MLRKLVRDRIEYHINPEALGKTRIAEASERGLLERWDEVLENIRAGEDDPNELD